MDFLRQMGIMDPRRFRHPVTIIGCGGIGSPTALTLAKVGCPHIVLIDPDRIEKHNIPNQIFRPGDEGKFKVQALADIIYEFTGTRVSFSSKAFSHGSLSGIIVSGVDSMKSRKDIWKEVRKNSKVPLYIDGRIGGEILEVYTVDPNETKDVIAYEDFLFSDKEAAHLSCTARAVMYVGFIIGGFMISQLSQFLRGRAYAKRIYLNLRTGVFTVA